MTDKHYFIERNGAGKWAVRARGSARASVIVDTQARAIAAAKRLNPDDKPDVERGRTTSEGKPDKWRSAS